MVSIRIRKEVIIWLTVDEDSDGDGDREGEDEKADL